MFQKIEKAFFCLVLLVFSACRPNQNVELENDRNHATFQVHDTLGPNEAHSINLSFYNRNDTIAENDMKEICAAVSRTPNIVYDILSIQTFSREDPIAARVEVPGRLLLLCKDENGKWRVLRVLLFHR